MKHRTKRVSPEVEVMGMKPVGHDGFEYVSDGNSKPLTGTELREWHKSTLGNCQRCGRRYADPNPQCPNFRSHGYDHPPAPEAEKE